MLTIPPMMISERQHTYRRTEKRRVTWHPTRYWNRKVRKLYQGNHFHQRLYYRGVTFRHLHRNPTLISKQAPRVRNRAFNWDASPSTPALQEKQHYQRPHQPLLPMVSSVRFRSTNVFTLRTVPLLSLRQVVEPAVLGAGLNSRLHCPCDQNSKGKRSGVSRGYEVRRISWIRLLQAVELLSSEVTGGRRESQRGPGFRMMGPGTA